MNSGEFSHWFVLKQKKKKSNKHLQNIFRTSHKISLYKTPHLGKFIKTWWLYSQKIFLFHTFLFINLSMKPLAVFPPLPHLQVHSLHVQVSVLYLVYTCSPVSGLSLSNSYKPVHSYTNSSSLLHRQTATEHWRSPATHWLQVYL